MGPALWGSYPLRLSQLPFVAKKSSVSSVVALQSLQREKSSYARNSLRNKLKVLLFKTFFGR